MALPLVALLHIAKTSFDMFDFIFYLFYHASYQFFGIQIFRGAAHSHTGSALSHSGTTMPHTRSTRTHTRSTRTHIVIRSIGMFEEPEYLSDCIFFIV